MKKPVSFLLAVMMAANFLFPTFLYGANSDIVLTEIAAYETANCEWIEIFNKGVDAVNLEGWKFFEANTNHGLTISASSTGQDWLVESGEYAIIAQNDTKLFSSDCSGYTAPFGTVFDSSWGTLNESGEEIGLKDSANTVIEQFSYVAAGEHSLERRDVQINEYTAANWTEHPTLNTFGAANSITSVETTAPIVTSTPPVIAELKINEFVADPAEGEREWIEVYNGTTSSVSLVDWFIHDGVGIIASPTGTIEATGFFVIEVSSRLNNAGDTIRLVYGGTNVDVVSYGNWDDGNLGDNVSVSARGNSTARRTGGSDTDNDSSDWNETTTLTKGSANQVTAPTPAVSLSPTSPPAASGSALPTYRVGDVVINELRNDPGDDEDEFVELFNKSGSTISLVGWSLEDGSEAKTLLDGTIQPQGFFVVSEPKGKLNNSGDIVILRDPTGREIDRVVYGGWNDGQVSDNAPLAENGASLARDADGVDTNNDGNDFSVTINVTKGSKNSIVADSMQSTVRTVGTTIVLNELLPNPEGSDEFGEFIELKNTSSSTVDLKGWKITTSLQEYVFGGGVVDGGSLVVLKRPQTKLVLHNDREEIKLFDASGRLIDRTMYKENAREAVSFVRRGAVWVWTLQTTEGEENRFVGNNQPPQLSIDVEREVGVGEGVVFDATDTIDPEGETFECIWHFGDGHDGKGLVVHHDFLSAKKFTTELQCTDARDGKSTSRVTITVKNRLAFVGGNSGVASKEDIQQLRISEIFPNPIEGDQKEFIELFNPTAKEIYLGGILLDDEEGGSRPYVIPDDVSVSPGAYLVFDRADTKLALNNSGDTVRLLLDEGTILQSVEYGTATEGTSYIQDAKGVWLWTANVTPGEKNVIVSGAKHVATASVKKSVSRTTGVMTTAIGDIRYADVGDRVRVTGVVMVKPGLLGTQYFYIADPTHGEVRGVQIYLFNKDFPPLNIGDVVAVTGEVSEARGEKRVKAKTKADIVRSGETQALTPTEIALADIDETILGGLATVAGEITQVRSGYVYIDDGEEELRVSFKKNIGVNTEQFHEGDMLTVTGILSKTTSEFQIIPRSQEDVSVEKKITAPGQEKDTPATGDLAVTETYLTATAGGLTSILIGLVAKARGAVAVRVVRRAGGVALAVLRRRKP